MKNVTNIDKVVDEGMNFLVKENKLMNNFEVTYFQCERSEIQKNDKSMENL